MSSNRNEPTMNQLMMLWPPRAGRHLFRWNKGYKITGNRLRSFTTASQNGSQLDAPVKSAENGGAEPAAGLIFQRSCMAVLTGSVLGLTLYASFNTYRYLCYVPEPAFELVAVLKDDPFLKDALGEWRFTGRWEGHMGTEDGKLALNLTGIKDGVLRSGILHVDLLRNVPRNDWEVITLRFGRTDKAAEAEGVAADENWDNVIFTSNNGPGTRTMYVPLEAMKTAVTPGASGCPVMHSSGKSINYGLDTDDNVAARQGRSVHHENQQP